MDNKSILLKGSSEAENTCVQTSMRGPSVALFPEDGEFVISSSSNSSHGNRRNTTRNEEHWSWWLCARDSFCFMVHDGTSAAHPQTLLFFISNTPGVEEVSQKGQPKLCLTPIENTLGMDQKAWIPCFQHLLVLHRNKMWRGCMWQMDLVVCWLGHLMDGPGKDPFPILQYMNFTWISSWINCTLGFSGGFEQMLRKNLCRTRKADAHLGKPERSLWGAKEALLGLCHGWAES